MLLPKCSNSGNHSDFSTGPIVQIIVGADRNEQSTTFNIHRDLITSRSPFCAKALKNYGECGNGDIQWLEGEERVVKMPEDDPAIFAN